MMSIFHAECEPTIGTEKNFLLVKCALCAKDMMLTDGSIIFGSKWYHENCFNYITRSKSIFTNVPKIQYDTENMSTD